MRYSSILALAGATAPLAVFADFPKGQLGFALGVRNPDGSCKDQNAFASDFNNAKGSSTLFRTYSNVDGGDQSGPVCQVLPALLPAAKAANPPVTLYLGIWADTDTAFNTDVSAFLQYAPDYQDTIVGVTVGSESLYRYEQDPTTGLSASDLLSRIQSFQQSLSNAKLDFPVGTADSWNKYQDGTANPIVPHVDFLFINAFGYWQSQDISNATATFLDDLQQAAQTIQQASGSDSSPELKVGETGWPTDGGSDYGAAKAGTANAQTFFSNGVCASLGWGWDTFYFEYSDEPWKPESAGLSGATEDETHWGAYNTAGTAKISLSC